MKSKAIKDLSQLSDNDLFKEISTGLELIFNHFFSIEVDLKHLAETNRQCGFNILESVLKEEAAKFLILIDAIRCPRITPTNFSKQLGRFNDHLAKGIYAFLYDLRPINFGEIQEVIEKECHEYYLDGPNDFDWIFRNDILQVREEKIYVDYIESDEDHMWLSPNRYYKPEITSTWPYLQAKIVEVGTSLWIVGCTTPDALRLIAETWRPVQMVDDFSWKELKNLNYKTLENLDEHGLIDTKYEKSINSIINDWLFPLHSIDIRKITVDINKLREKQEQMLFNMIY